MQNTTRENFNATPQPLDIANEHVAVTQIKMPVKPAAAPSHSIFQSQADTASTAQNPLKVYSQISEPPRIRKQNKKMAAQSRLAGKPAPLPQATISPAILSLGHQPVQVSANQAAIQEALKRNAEAQKGIPQSTDSLSLPSNEAQVR